MPTHTHRGRGLAALPVHQVLPPPAALGPATREPFLFLAPPVPGRPLPARLSPRRLPLRVRLRRAGRLPLCVRRATAQLQRAAHGRTTDRLFWLLAAAVTGAALVFLIVTDPSGAVR